MNSGNEVDLIYLDTNILIYLLEGIQPYALSIADTLDQHADKGGQLTTSVITVTEFLAGSATSSIEDLKQIPRLEFEPVDLETADYAANILRHDPSMRIGDAIHLATALWVGADTFYTNDKRLIRAAHQAHLKTLPV